MEADMLIKLSEMEKSMINKNHKKPKPEGEIEELMDDMLQTIESFKVKKKRRTTKSDY